MSLTSLLYKTGPGEGDLLLLLFNPRSHLPKENLVASVPIFLLNLDFFEIN